MSKTDILDIFAKRNVLPIRQIQDEAKAFVHTSSYRSLQQ